MVNPPEASLSVTSTKSMAKVPLAVRLHWLVGESETRLIRSSLSMPWRVRRPEMVCVAVLSKVRVKSVLLLEGSIFVRLLKVVEPVID